MGTGSTSRGITETDVWQAADALLLEGARPTIERVRQKVGRGSPNTVSPYLDTWFRKLGARIKDPMAFSAPPAIPDPVQQAAAHFWEAALANARELVTTDLAKERAATEADRRTASEERSSLVRERERLDAQAQARDDIAQVLRDQLGESQRLADELRNRLQGQAGEAAAMREAVDRLTAERDAFRTHLEAQRVAHEDARANIEARAAAHEKRWTMEVDRARETLKAAQQQMARLEKDSAGHIERLTRDANEATKERERVERAHAADQAELQRLRRDSDAAAKRERAMTAQVEKLQEQLNKALDQSQVRAREHSTLLRSLLNQGGRAPITPKARNRAVKRP